MIPSKKSKNKEKRTYWENHIKEWRMSGFTQNEYCKQNQLDPSTFSGWKKEVLSGSENNPFVELKLPENITGEPVVEIEIGKSVCLRVRESINPCVLRELVLALTGGC